jgi:hypothetical protein
MDAVDVAETNAKGVAEDEDRATPASNDTHRLEESRSSHPALVEKTDLLQLLKSRIIT